MADLPMVWETFRDGEDGYNEGWGGNRNTVTEEVSRSSGTQTSVDSRFLTYLIMKIHLQVVLAAIAPPIMGPTRRAIALVMEMFATTCAYFSGGTRSKTMIVQREKQPPPPIPWKARRIILPQVSLLWSVIYIRIVPHSCVNVWAPLQAAENMMKMAVDSKKRGFRPKMSLNLAKMTMTATVRCK